MSKPDWLKKAEAEGRIRGITKINTAFFDCAQGVQTHTLTVSPIAFGAIIASDPKAIAEDVFQDMVATVARENGWAVVHFRSAKLGDSYMTPTMYDASGFPDLVLVRDRVIYSELKTEFGTLTPEEETWRTKLLSAKQEYHLWRPSHWRLIKSLLEASPPVPPEIATAA